MKTRIDIEKAIEALEKNLAEHKTEYNDAIRVWTADATKALAEMRDALTRDGLKVSTQTLWGVFHAKPIDNRADYSKFLGMLRRAHEGGETHVECDEDDYDRIFQDNWDWRVGSKARNTMYSSRKP